MAKVGRPSKVELERRAAALKQAADDLNKPLEKTEKTEIQEASSVSSEKPFDPATYNGGYETAVGAETPASPNEPPLEGPKRGRPRGSINKPVAINVTGLEALLMGLGTTLQAATKAPEFGLSQIEAHNIADAWAEAAKHYPVLNLDPKIAALVNLGTTVSIVTGSRITAFKLRKAIERQARQRTQQTQQNAPPITPAPPRMAVMQEQTNMHIPEPPKPPKPTPEMLVGEIPGVGNVQFPLDHELVKGRTH